MGYRKLEMKVDVLRSDGRWQTGRIKVAKAVFEFCCYNHKLLALVNGNVMNLEPDEQQLFGAPFLVLAEDPWKLHLTFELELTPEIEAILSRDRFGLGADEIFVHSKL